MRNLRLLEVNLLKNALEEVQPGFKRRQSDSAVEALHCYDSLVGWGVWDEVGEEEIL